jgi:hypothetical protein
MIGFLLLFSFALVKGFETWQSSYFFLAIAIFLFDMLTGNELYIRLTAWVEKKETTLEIDYSGLDDGESRAEKELHDEEEEEEMAEKMRSPEETI